MFNNYPVNPVLLSPVGRTYYYIQTHLGCKITDLSKDLYLTTRAIRPHLDILLSQRLITSERGEGRWSYYYIKE